MSRESQSLKFPLHRLPSGHLALDIAEADKKISDGQAIRGREDDVFEAESREVQHPRNDLSNMNHRTANMA